MRILITNDDGILAPGIQSLARAVSRWIDEAPAGEVREAIVVAPNRNYSGMSAAVGDVFSEPYTNYEHMTIDGAPNVPAYALEGPPALCAILGGIGSFGERPDVVLSGVNAGANVGRSVLHSGTVGAILTGAQLGCSGLAVSIQWGDEVHYDTASAVAVEVLQEFLTAPSRTLLNLNVPNLRPDQLKGVKRGRISMAGVIKSARPENDAPLEDKGRLSLRLGAATPDMGDVSDENDDEDGALVVAGYASLTALRGPREDNDPALDSVMHSALATIERHLASHR
jgi:5'-nucleotidase